MLFVAAVGIFCAYHVNWIRQRHEFLARNAAKNKPYDFFGHPIPRYFSTDRIDSVAGTYHRKTEKSFFNFLCLFDELPRSSVMLTFDIDQEPRFMEKEELVTRHEGDFQTAERLFPEAEIQFRIIVHYNIPVDVQR